jgi:hypothetical protein
VPTDFIITLNKLQRLVVVVTKAGEVYFAM